MPAWKWGPDNANLKLAVQGAELTFAGQFGLRGVRFPEPGQLLFSKDEQTVTTFSQGQMANPIISVVCKIIRAGSFPDIEVPISSFQIFRNKGKKNTVQITVPDFSLSDAISDRAAGSLALYRLATGRGARTLIEMAICKITDVRSDEGAHNKSITIQAAE